MSRLTDLTYSTAEARIVAIDFLIETLSERSPLGDKPAPWAPGAVFRTDPALADRLVEELRAAREELTEDEDDDSKVCRGGNYPWSIQRLDDCEDPFDGDLEAAESVAQTLREEGHQNVVVRYYASDGHEVDGTTCRANHRYDDALDDDELDRLEIVTYDPAADDDAQPYIAHLTDPWVEVDGRRVIWYGEPTNGEVRL